MMITAVDCVCFPPFCVEKQKKGLLKNYSKVFLLPFHSLQKKCIEATGAKKFRSSRSRYGSGN